VTLSKAREFIKQVQFRDWTFVVESDGPSFYLQVVFNAPDLTTGKVENWTSRKWRLSAYMTKSELVATALKAVLTAVEHEAREAFLYQGHAIFGPHHDVDSLVELVKRTDRDARNKPAEAIEQDTMRV
jgi:hypothetical protein